MTTQKPWQQHLRDELAGRIAVPFDLTITKDSHPMRASLLISIRKLSELDDEIAYWREELEGDAVPLVRATYSPSRNTQTRYIRFILYETPFAAPVRAAAGGAAYL